MGPERSFARLRRGVLCVRERRATSGGLHPGLSDEEAGRLFGFVDNIASDWPLRHAEGADWKPLGGAATGCHEVRLRVWKSLHRLFVRLDGERRRFVLLDGETKRVDALLPEAVYRRVGRLRDDYTATLRVSPAK